MLRNPADFGTAEEAKAMLEKAVAAVKENKAKALDMFNKGEGGFKDRDLYNGHDADVTRCLLMTLSGIRQSRSLAVPNGGTRGNGGIIPEPRRRGRANFAQHVRFQGQSGHP